MASCDRRSALLPFLNRKRASKMWPQSHVNRRHPSSCHRGSILSEYAGRRLWSRGPFHSSAPACRSSAGTSLVRVSAPTRVHTALFKPSRQHETTRRLRAVKGSVPNRFCEAPMGGQVGGLGLWRTAPAARPKVQRQADPNQPSTQRSEPSEPPQEQLL